MSYFPRGPAGWNRKTSQRIASVIFVRAKLVDKDREWRTDEREVRPIREIREPRVPDNSLNVIVCSFLNSGMVHDDSQENEYGGHCLEQI